MSRVTRGDDLQAIIDRSRRLKAAANARAARRRDHALQVAKDLAAEMGKQDRSVKRVILFGSLLPGRAFRGESDIDLAIDGGDMPLLERIALDRDSRHKELLRRMTMEIETVRPALLNEATYLLVDELRSFRHLIHCRR
ncbi:MAG: nucleotidyltransferase domain-containing protein [Alkalispirochaeta sp.]